MQPQVNSSRCCVRFVYCCGAAAAGVAASSCITTYTETYINTIQSKRNKQHNLKLNTFSGLRNVPWLGAQLK